MSAVRIEICNCCKVQLVYFNPDARLPELILCEKCLEKKDE